MGDPERFNLSITDPRVDSGFIYPDPQSVKEFARVNIRRFVSWCGRNLCFEDPILDVACGYRNNRPEIDPEFKRKFITTDLNPSLKPDFVADASKLPIASGSIGCVLCTEMLEHVPSPPTLITEIVRILKPGGLLIITVPFWVPIHEKGSWQLDYWRFTPRGLYQLLFSEFRDIRIQRREHRQFPVEVLAHARKK